MLKAKNKSEGSLMSRLFLITALRPATQIPLLKDILMFGCFNNAIQDFSADSIPEKHRYIQNQQTSMHTFIHKVSIKHLKKNIQKQELE